jgi:cardiolipin synthase
MLRKIGRIGRGANARILLPNKSDNGATIGASRLLYKPLIKRGVKIWEFLPTKLHTKLIVVDNVVYIGSGNFDVRSLYLNLEVMLRIEDAALAERMRAYVTEQLPASQRITQAIDRSHRTLFNRIRWGLSWFLVTVVDYSITRRLNLGLGSVYVRENDDDDDDGGEEDYSSS